MAESEDLAGLGRRFVAQVLDLLVLFLVAYAIAIVTGDTSAAGFELQGGPAFLWFAVAFAYFIGLEAATGQTVGKRLTGITVRPDAGGDLSLQDAVVRNVLRLVDGIVFYAIGALLVLASDREQRLGDRVADTVVVRVGSD